MTPDDTYLHAALAYVKGTSPLGVPVAVVPTKGDTKRPLIRWGDSKAPSTSQEVHEVWTRFPEARVSVVLKPTRLIVLDIEGPGHGFDEAEVIDAVEEAFGTLPLTLTAGTSGGGRHLYFQVPDSVDLDAFPTGPVHPLTGEVVKGVELKRGSDSPTSSGNLDAVPALMDGQVHDGRSWIELAEIASLPRSLYPPTRNARSPVPEGAIPGGGRRSALLKVAGAMRKVGAGVAAIEAALRSMNAERCSPPLGDDEVTALAHDVANRYSPDEALMPEPPPDLPSGMSGAEVLDAVERVVARFVVLPSTEALDAVVLFVACTHAIEAFDVSPYLHVTSPERRSGKTLLLEVLADLVAHPMHASSMTAAVVYRALVLHGVRRTLILDEVDAVFGSKAGEAGEALRTILNAGTRRKSSTVMRINANTMKVEEFDAFGAKVLGGIGDLPDTVADRSIRIAMRRALPAELEQLGCARTRDVTAACGEVEPLVLRWAADIADQAATLRPARLPELNPRAMDTWEPLLALAELAGGQWPERARAAAVALSGERESDAEDGGLARRLLYDCHEAFGDRERVSSSDLVTALRGMPDSPWSTLGGLGLEASKLAFLLRQYEVRPEKLRLPEHEQAVRGYKRERFADAWQRYVGFTDADEGPTPDETRNTRNTPANTGNPTRNTQEGVPAIVPGENPHGNGNVPGVPGNPEGDRASADVRAVIKELRETFGDGVTVEEVRP